MKTLKFLAFAAFAVCLAACGGDKSDGNSVTFKVEAELGQLADYITVADQEVVVTMSNEKEDGEEYRVITSSLALQVSKSVATDYGFDFDVEVLDKNHVKIGELSHYDVEATYDYDNGQFNRILHAGSVRAQMEDRDNLNEITPKDQEELDKLFKEGVYIVVKPRWSSGKYAEYKEKSSNSEGIESSSDVADDADDSDAEEVAESSSSSSEDWDAALDSYEKYVDKYIALLKKASKGDMTAMAEYPALLQQAEEFGDKLSGAKGNLTASQAARYSKIQMKMLKAAQEMK